MKSRNKIILTSIALMFSTMALSAPIPVDLTKWVSEGDGAWTLSQSNESVTQSINGDQTVFFEPASSSLNTIFSATISVGSARYDDDFIGFVLGYQAGELVSNTAEYYIIDWKRVTQSFEGDTANRGLAFSTVNGQADFGDLWSHTGTVSEISRGDTLGDTGWRPNLQYDFDIFYTSGLIEVFVNETLQLSVTAAEAGLSNFSDGAIGFYNLSQSEVTYSALSTEKIVPVSTPSSIAFICLSMLGLAYVRRASSKKS